MPAVPKERPGKSGDGAPSGSPADRPRVTPAVTAGTGQAGACGPRDTRRPGWPGSRWAQGTVDDLLAAVPVSDAARSDLRRRMAAPGRHYHGLRHLALLWTRHLALGRGSDLHEP